MSFLLKHLLGGVAGLIMAWVIDLTGFMFWGVIILFGLVGVGDDDDGDEGYDWDPWQPACPTPYLTLLLT